ncbi:unnamed protein product [Mesocestoides corti]|uniref:Mitochondrial ribosomal protein S34 n=1 Tax=Mesocestoides corti TaxID=53468 RepID=A0A0R3U2J6_MESCO|nr:unnamed protein product [Mesocestoides corti]
MPKIKFVGRPSLDFYGKYLSEIAKNLCNRGRGRVVVKEQEESRYKEPCFYVIKNIDPLMSDSSGVRCRAYAERVFRGRNFGVAPIPKSYEPDFRLLSIEEGRKLQELASQKDVSAPDVPIKCVAPMPPVLAIKLQRLGKIPQATIDAARRAVPPNATPAAREGEGFLLLTKIPDDPTLFLVPIEPAEEEKIRIFPDYEMQAKDGLVEKTSGADEQRNVYYIRRSDSPGIRWRVELADKNVEDELLQPRPKTAKPSSGVA